MNERVVSGFLRSKIFEEQMWQRYLINTREELAESFGVTQQTISKRHKQGSYLPYELKPTDFEQRLYASHRIVTADENCVHYDTPKRRNSWVVDGQSAYSCLQGHAEDFGGISLASSTTSETITADRYPRLLIRLSRALKDKRP